MPKIIFIFQDQTRKEVEAPLGVSLLEVAHSNDIHEIEGACGGALACSTCHMVLPNDWFEKLDPPSEEEEDMLDLAHGLTKTSRLGCQIVVTEEMDGIEITVPGGRQDFIS
ncbi:MAG: ferredoxin family 2Fe-2S iron-sulfur cluster binding protein [Alphaproteobacteria bacterium]|nr:ferredoxin family 2Fe-2S iron-sulfur cluster binding protein [Alphaproteobacteria bacterium]